jgi:hypothetical protein
MLILACLNIDYRAARLEELEPARFSQFSTTAKDEGRSPRYAGSRNRSPPGATSKLNGGCSREIACSGTGNRRFGSPLNVTAYTQ